MWREDAVLHVKHRHVLVDDDLEQIRARSGDHRRELLPVQIVARHHPHESRVGEDLRGELVGDVERVIADLRQIRSAFAIETNGREIPDEHASGEQSRIC